MDPAFDRIRGERECALSSRGGNDHQSADCQRDDCRCDEKKPAAHLTDQSERTVPLALGQFVMQGGNESRRQRTFSEQAPKKIGQGVGGNEGAG